MIDHISAVNMENDTELPWLIGLGANYDQN